MKPLGPAKVQDSIIQCFSPKHDEDMSDEDEGWQGTGAFPRGSQSEELDHIFVDEAFEGHYDSLGIVNEDSRETTSSSQDGLMAISHASSETPAISNTASAVRNALKKQTNKAQSPVEKKSGGFYPFNIYQSLSKEKDVGTATDHNQALNMEEGRKEKKNSQRDRENSTSTSHHHILPPMPMEDENASAITDDHQDHSHYAMESASIQHPMSVMSARSRHHGGGSKHHLIRHTLASTQQISANPGHMLKNLFINIEQERQMHKLTAQHLRAIHNWLFFLPAILLTLCAGVIVLVFEANLDIDDGSRVYSSIAVGIIAMVSVVFQALCKQLDLGVRGALHGSTAIALKRLSEDILLTLSAAETIPAEYVALIGEKFGQAVDACPSNIPYQLEAAFAAMSDRMILMFRPPTMGIAPRKPVQKVDHIRLYATAYDELSAEIIDYFWFPFGFPNPRTASDAALSNFKSIVTEGRELDRSRNWRKWLCPCFSPADEERSLFDVLPLASQIEPNSSSSAQIPMRNYMLGTEL
ncbi:MAG: hypothetical protein SGILL_006018 [Bacillariaceae sp.]